MLNKRAFIILFIYLLFSGPIFASDKPKIDLDPWGNISSFWLAPKKGNVPKEKELKFSKSNFTEPRTLYIFSQEATSFDLQVENTKISLVFTLKDSNRKTSRLYLTQSRDAGQTFSPPLLISAGGENLSLAMKDDLITIAWEEKDRLYFIKTEDGGKNFTPPEVLHITGEVLSSPSLTIDKFKNIYLSFLSKHPDINLNRIICTQLAGSSSLLGVSPKLKVLFESQDNIINLKIKNLDNYESGLLVFWQKEYSERRNSYFAISLDRGQNFGPEKIFDFQPDLIDLGLVNGNFSALTYNDKPVLNQYASGLIIQKLNLPPLPAPQILFPTENAVLNSSNLKLIYSLLGRDPLLGKVDLSLEKAFPADKSRSFEQLISPLTQEVIKYNLPADLGDGTYFLRAYTFNGIDTSSPSQIRKFRVDNLPPKILTLEAERIERTLTLAGKINEFPAWLTINGKPASLESNTQFKTQLVLEPGKNYFTFVLTDEAGNLSISTQEVFYNSASPEITVLKPGISDWFKPNSVILIEGQAYDLQDDLEDETEAKVIIGNEILEDALIFDRQKRMLSGFITLPSNLMDGKYAGTIILTDKLGNKGKGDLAINIDGSPPFLNQKPGEACFTGSQTTVALPLVDEGAGLDPYGTLIKISGLSFEGTVSREGEKLVLASQQLLGSNLPLFEGSYEVAVIPRDLIGNIGKPSSFSLVVDTTPPQLTLEGSYESQTHKNKIIVQGRVKEKYPASVNIYINQKKIESFNLAGDYFSKEIGLFPGSNEILIEALDKAGNKTQANLSTLAAFSVASSLIQNCMHGPNPFSPQKNLPGALSSQGKGMVFSYALSQPTDVRILIFDLTGTLIWTKEIKNITAGVTAWSGEDAFGQVVGNGIYPYIFSATANGATEIRRGKIIVYQ